MNASSRQPLDATTRGHMPAAEWTVGGLFRFEHHLLTLLNFLRMYYPPRTVGQVAGAPPCAWTLEPRGELSPILSMEHYLAVLQGFADIQTGVTLVFDNPAPPAEGMEDEYAHSLVQCLSAAEYNPTGRNAVCVASDALAELLRARYPQLPIICHPNRLIVATEPRTLQFYARLEELYSRIILHPRDAVTPAVYAKLTHPERYMAVVNDPAPRNSPTRRYEVNLLAALHRNPWDGSLRRSLARMRQMEGRSIENTCNLTRLEEAALYEAGIRSFVVQAAAFRNEITLLHDLFYHLLRTEPELSNKAALIISAGMAHIRPREDCLPSGMEIFHTADEPL